MIPPLTHASRVTLVTGAAGGLGYSVCAPVLIADVVAFDWNRVTDTVLFSANNVNAIPLVGASAAYGAGEQAYHGIEYTEPVSGNTLPFKPSLCTPMPRMIGYGGADAWKCGE